MPLDYLDQTAAELRRATGRGQLIQAVWIYDHGVDRDGLARIHRRLGTDLLGRLIERSPLPFARPHWVSCAGPPSEIITFAEARPRDEVMEWADELAARPIDPEEGPGWFLAVLPLTDGATAVSLVMSHCLVDGGGAIVAVWDALLGHERDFGYRAPRSRTLIEAVAADLRECAREVPQLVRSLRTVAGTALRDRSTRGSSVQSAEGDDTVVTIPSAVAFVDCPAWDFRAAELGGNSYTLASAVAARIAHHFGRTRGSDGAVTLIVVGSGRTGPDDDRALAMTFANATVDPDGVTSDLTGIRAAVRAARDRVSTDPDPSLALLPLVPWFPQPMARAFVGQMFSYQDSLPVSCSNLGELPADLVSLDGTPAEFFFARSMDQNVTLRDLNRSHGTLVVVTGRVNGKTWIAVEAYQLGAENSGRRLRSVLDEVLGEFQLSGVIV